MQWVGHWCMWRVGPWVMQWVGPGCMQWVGPGCMQWVGPGLVRYRSGSGKPCRSSLQHPAPHYILLQALLLLSSLVNIPWFVCYLCMLAKCMAGILQLFFPAFQGVWMNASNPFLQLDCPSGNVLNIGGWWGGERSKQQKAAIGIVYIMSSVACLCWVPSQRSCHFDQCMM